MGLVRRHDISANAVLFRPERGLPRDVRFAASRSLYEEAGRVGLRHEDEGIVRGNVVIIRPNDRLTVGTEADFRGSGAALLDGGQTRMVLELASVPAIDTRAKRILGFTLVPRAAVRELAVPDTGERFMV